MARNLGKQVAEEISNAHEARDGQSNEELNMDLWNNKIGRELGSDPANAGKSIDEIMQEAIKNGLLQTSPEEDTQKLIDNYIKYRKIKKLKGK